MNKTMRAFAEIKTISDFKQELENSVEYVNGSYFNQETLETAITSLNSMPAEQQARFLSFIHHVDRTMSMAGAAKANRYHKIPTALAGCIYFAQFPETIKDLSYDELSVLARHSAIAPLAFYESAVEKYGQELLAAIVAKSEDYMYRGTYLALASQKISEGQSKEEVVNYITNMPLNELKEESLNAIWKVGKYI